MRVGLRLKQRNILPDKMVSVQATKKTEERMFLMANSLAHTKWVGAVKSYAQISLQIL